MRIRTREGVPLRAPLGARGSAVAIAVLLAACSTSAQSTKSPAPTDVVGTVGSASITLAEVDQRALQKPVDSFGSLKLGQALYEARRAALDDIVGDLLVAADAKGRGMDRAALEAQEIDAKAAPVSNADVAAWYQANSGRVQGAPLDQVRAPIKSLLMRERNQAAYQAYVDRLKTRTPVRILLDPPRQKIAAAGAPSKGPADAPIEMIEFSDFQCPFCLRAQPTVTQVFDTYGNRIRLVYRNYPLPNHPNARPAAEAAQCAAEQDKFWPFHDRLFANPTKLADGDFKQAAADLGLDVAQFNSCVDAHKYKGRIDADIQAGTDVGVNGTPAFFINGRLISGSQPFAVFKRIIDDELELKRK